MIQQQHLRSARVENFAAGQVGKSADKETRPDRRSIGRILYRRTQNARIKSVEVANDSAQDFGQDALLFFWGIIQAALDIA